MKEKFILSIKNLVLVWFYLVSSHANADFQLPEFTVYDLVEQQHVSMEYGNELVDYNGQLYFSASDKGLGFELWTIDLATGKQYLIQDINKGTQSSKPSNFIVYQNKLYFTAFTEEHGREIWFYDSKTSTAQLLADLNTGVDDNGIALNTDVFAFTIFNDQLLFFINTELWSFNANSNEFAPHSSNFNWYWGISFSDVTPNMYVIDEELYALIYTSEWPHSDENQLWRFDKNTNRFVELDLSTVDIPFRHHTKVNSTHLYAHDFGPILEQFNKQTRETITFELPVRFYSVLPLEDDLLISDSNQLYRFATETETLTVIKDFSHNNYRSNGFSKNAIQIGNYAYFFAINEQNKYIPWQLSLDNNQINQLFPENIAPHTSSAPTSKVIYNNQLIFTAQDSNNQAQIWLYNSNSDLASPISSFSDSGTIFQLTVVKNKLFFIYSLAKDNDQLWQYDNHNNAFTHIPLYEESKDLETKYALSSLVELNDELYFINTEIEKSPEIWTYNENELFPIQHTNFTQTQTTSIFTSLVKYRNSVYFGLKDDQTSNELWYLYSKNKTYNPVTTSQDLHFQTIDDLIVLNNKLYFTYQSDSQLAYYDNVINRFSENSVTMPTDFYVDGERYADLTMHLGINNKLVYVNNHRFTHGVEPYYFSEEHQTNKLLADIRPGGCCIEDQTWEGFSWGSYPNNFYSYDNILYFNAHRDTNGYELWSSADNGIGFNEPAPLSYPSKYEQLTNVTDIISFDGALFATAHATKDGVNYGTELVKLDINITPSILLNIPDKTIEGRVLSLDASNSTDEDGDELSFTWHQTAGSSVELINDDTAQAYFTAPKSSETPLLFELTVSDGEKEAKQTVTIEVAKNYAPTITLIKPIDEVIENSTVNVEVEVSDVNNDELTVSWEQILGPKVSINSTDLTNITFTSPLVDEDTYIEIQATVSDGLIANSINISIMVKNKIEVVINETQKDNKSGGVINFLVLLLLLASRFINFNGQSKTDLSQ